MVNIWKKGEQVIFVPIKKATWATFSFTCESDLAGGTAYPQAAIVFPDNTGLSTITATATSTAHSFVMAVDATYCTAQDAIGKLIFKGMETASGAYAKFHSLTVT